MSVLCLPRNTVETKIELREPALAMSESWITHQSDKVSPGRFQHLAAQCEWLLTYNHFDV